MRVELIQDGMVKGWSTWANANLEPEETIDFALTVDKWNWKDESSAHSGDYTLCLSMRNPYGDIWIPMGQGKKVTVSDTSAIDDVSIDNNYNDAIYDLQGRKVTDDTNTLSPGIYIKLNNGVASKIALPSR